MLQRVAVLLFILASTAVGQGYPDIEFQFKYPTLRVWHVVSGKQVYTSNEQIYDPKHPQISSDNRLLALTPQSDELMLIDIASGKVCFRHKLDQLYVMDFSFSPDSQQLACISGRIQIFSTATGALLHDVPTDNPRQWRHSTNAPETFRLAVKDGAHTMAVAPFGQLLACNRERNLEVWDLGRDKLLHTFPDSTARAVAFTDDAHTLVALTHSNTGGSLHIRSLTTGKVVRRSMHYSAIMASNGLTIAQRGSSAVHVFDTLSGETRLVLRVSKPKDLRNNYLFRSVFVPLALSPDGNYLVTYDSMDVIW